MPALEGELLCSQAAIEPLVFDDHSFQCVRTVLLLLMFLTLSLFLQTAAVFDCVC